MLRMKCRPSKWHRTVQSFDRHSELILTRWGKSSLRHIFEMKAICSNYSRSTVKMLQKKSSHYATFENVQNHKYWLHQMLTVFISESLHTWQTDLSYQVKCSRSRSWRSWPGTTNSPCVYRCHTALRQSHLVQCLGDFRSGGVTCGQDDIMY